MECLSFVVVEEEADKTPATEAQKDETEVPLSIEVLLVVRWQRLYRSPTVGLRNERPLGILCVPHFPWVIAFIHGGHRCFVQIG